MARRKSNKSSTQHAAKRQKRSFRSSFTRTLHPSVIATPNVITEMNQQQCPLLRLPLEVRLQIFEYVLGGNRIHVEKLDEVTRRRMERDGFETGNELWNELCMSKQSDWAACDHFHNPDNDNDEAKQFLYGDNYFGYGDGFYVEAHSSRHFRCGENPRPNQYRVDFSRWRARSSFTCTPLRICKQLYRETRLIPYSHNTFCFKSARTFQFWCMSVARDQLRAIRSMSIRVSIGSSPYSDARSRDWAAALWFGDVAKAIGSLKQLYIGVEMYINPEDQAMTTKPTVDDFNEYTHFANAPRSNWISELAPLCKGECMVRMTVTDDAYSPWGIIGRPQYCRDFAISSDEWSRRRKRAGLTVAQKRLIARQLERLLSNVSESRLMELIASRGTWGIDI